MLLALTALMAGVLVPAVVAPGQAAIDHFPYPASSPTIPNWSTEFGGDWQVTGTELLSDINFGWQFLLRDSIQDCDCAVENVVRYDTPSHTQFGGPVVRAAIKDNVLSTYMAKVQDNFQGGIGYFNRVYLYFYVSPLGMYRLSYQKMVASTVVRCRLVSLDEQGAVRIMGYWDTDMDGIWDIRLTVFNQYLVGVSGSVGVNGFSRSRFDDWKYWDAVLYERNAAPRPGETLELVGRSQPSASYIAASSLSNMGGMMLGGKTIPLYPDSLMVMSMSTPEIFQNYSGTFDSRGDAVLKVVIPNDSALVGVVFYTAFVSMTTSPPTQVLEVSNDVQVRII